MLSRLARIARFTIWRVAQQARARVAGVRLTINAPLRGAPASVPRLRMHGDELTITLGPGIRFGRDVVLELARGVGRIEIGEGTLIGDRTLLRVLDGSRDPWEHRVPVGLIKIGARCQIRDHVVMRSLHNLRVGDDCMVSYFCVLHCGSGTTLGDRVTLAERVTIADTDHSFDEHDTYHAPAIYDPVVIGSNVLVSANTVITRGTTLSDNTIVAASSVVRGASEEGTLLAGIPAVEKRRLH